MCGRRFIHLLFARRSRDVPLSKEFRKIGALESQQLRGFGLVPLGSFQRIEQYEVTIVFHGCIVWKLRRF